jgi:Tol biopolymer transport system component
VALPETLNHYRILGPLGSGGMGEVYAAEDTRLHRKVALKVLPPLLSQDPERRQRLEREAQLVAALNHPNIVTIHSVEEDQNILFLTMELVEGKPLSERAPGGLPLDALLSVGIAVSDAVAAAHQRGIMHRDLKPANIMVTPDGRLKVLDFGLAKLREVEQAAVADDVTRVPSQDLTGEGRIIGTVAYMSPEQAEGKPLDPRSDIFSLGVVLHELATGEKPFKGDTTVSLISSILKDTPTPVTDIRPSLPPGLSRVIRRSLAKDPSRRYQTATDLRNDLEDLKQEIDSGIVTSVTTARPQPVASRRGLGRPAYLVLALLVVFIAALGYGYWRQQAPPTPGDVLAIERPARLTSGGNAALAAMSPDGRYVAHVKNDPGAPSLWMRQATTTSDVQIVPQAAVRYDGVTFSPDGDHVYFVTYGLTGGVGSLYRVPALGGPPQKILEDVDSRIVFSPDRAQFAFLRGVPTEGAAFVMLANADGSNVRRLAQLQRPSQFTLNGLTWTADGRSILAGARSLDGGPHELIVAVDAGSGETRPLEGRWNSIVDLEWVQGTNSFVAAAAEVGVPTPQLWQITYPEGQRRRITNDLNTYSSLSLSADAKSLATVQTEAIANLWISNAQDPSSAVQITRGRGRGDGLNGLDWTPDGRVVFISTASGQPQVWITDADGKSARQLTGASQEPVLSASVDPDGRYIVFQRMIDRRMRVWRMNLDGSDQKPITAGPLDLGALAGPGGVVYFYRVSDGVPRTYRVSIDGGDETVVDPAQNFRPVDVSPDGARLLGVGWDEKQRRSSLAIMTASGGPVDLLSSLPTFAGVFSHDASGVVFPVQQKGSLRLDHYDLATGKTSTIGMLPDHVFRGALSPDGTRIALARGEIVSDVLVLTMRRE